MSTADEYRAYADECFGWAKTSKTDREREIFLQMAQTWLAASVRANGGDHLSKSIEQSVPGVTTAK